MSKPEKPKPKPKPEPKPEKLDVPRNLAMARREQLAEPDEIVHNFWESFLAKKPGFARRLLDPEGPLGWHRTSYYETGDRFDDEPRLYADAKRACIRKVNQIVRECRRNNEKFTDHDFNILDDLETNKVGSRDCLEGLPIPYFEETSEPKPKASKIFIPGSAHRASWIFEDHHFAAGAQRSNIGISTDDLQTPHSLRSWLRYAAYTLVVLIPLLVTFSFSQPVPKSFSVVTFGPALTITMLLCVLSAYVNGAPHSSTPRFLSVDVKQGAIGNCWFINAIASLCSRDELLARACVAWDQDCGVYGFLFFRDGGWIYSVVDDYLYLKSPDYLHTLDGKKDPSTDLSKRYMESKQRGSDALYFAKCDDPNTSWLPLLEKAYAKAHGDYDAMRKGLASAGIEDLTGGVSTTTSTDSIMDKDRLWQELRANDSGYLFAVSTPRSKVSDEVMKSSSLAFGHSFTLLEARETMDCTNWNFNKVRLLKIRNPWGQRRSDGSGNWRGAWSDGSTEWSIWTMFKLGRRFRDDGIFYITFDDMLSAFNKIERTRLFDRRAWTVKQEWTSMAIEWAPQYNPKYFIVRLHKRSEVVFVLSKLDGRYFRGLEGRYHFHLSMVLRKGGTDGEECIARASAPTYTWRSVSLEKELEAGDYEIRVKITATLRNYGHNGDTFQAAWSVEDMVKLSMERPEKLQRLARNYDIAYQDLDELQIRQNHPSVGREEESAKDTVSIHPNPSEVAWNAICGVGLRVYCRDPDVGIDVCNEGIDHDKPEFNNSYPERPRPGAREDWHRLTAAANWTFHILVALFFFAALLAAVWLQHLHWRVESWFNADSKHDTEWSLHICSRALYGALRRYTSPLSAANRTYIRAEERTQSNAISLLFIVVRFALWAQGCGMHFAAWIDTRVQFAQRNIWDVFLFLVLRAAIALQPPISRLEKHLVDTVAWAEGMARRAGNAMLAAFWLIILNVAILSQGYHLDFKAWVQARMK